MCKSTQVTGVLCSVQAHATATITGVVAQCKREGHPRSFSLAVKNPLGFVSVQSTLTRLIAIYMEKDKTIIFLCQDNREPEQFLNSLMEEKGEGDMDRRLTIYR